MASAPAEEEAAPTAIPQTADAIWKALDQQSADLKATISSGGLKDVHHKAFAIRDLVAALPSHSPTLPADDQTKLQGEIKFVATLADRLDAAGDSNDKAGAQDNYDKQLERGLISCPHCGSSEIRRVPSAVHLARTANTPTSNEQLPKTSP